MPEPLVVQAVRGQRDALLARDAAQMTSMAKVWATAEQELASSMDALSLQIDAIRKTGEAVTPGKVYRLERYSRLLFEVRRETEKYADYTDRLVTKGQEKAAWLGEQDANHVLALGGRGRVEGLSAQAQAEIAEGRAKITEADRMFTWATNDQQVRKANRLSDEGAAQVTKAMAGGAPSAEGFAGASFARLDPRAVESMVGMMGDGTPLRQYLQGVYGDAAKGMSSYLTRAVTQGLNPRQTAREMRKGLGLGLDRALTIARTEQLRVYRESSRLTYEASGVVQAYKRLSAKQRRTCLGCLIADGDIIPLGESFSDHVQGRCVAVPVLIDGDIPQWETGSEWLAKQSDATQLQIMGPTRHELWQTGQVPLKQMVKHTHDPLWGGSLGPTPVKELFVEDKAVAAALKAAA